MKVYLFNILLYTLGLNIFSCSNSTPTIKNNKLQMGSTIYQKQNYDSIIMIIAKKAEGFETSQGLLLIDEFKELFEHDSLYVEDAIDFLAKDSATLQQKKITIYAMQNLEIDSYIKFCKMSKVLFDENKIPEFILKTAVNPNFLKKYLIIRNYGNPNVVALLQTIKSDTKVSSDFKQWVDEVLSGKSWNDIEKFTEDSGR